MFHQISISLAGEKEIVRLVKSAYRFITFSDKMPYPREISVLTIYIMKYNIIVSQSQPYNLQYIPWETIKLKPLYTAVLFSHRKIGNPHNCRKADNQLYADNQHGYSYDEEK